jgi:hypothetical protein
VKVSANFLPRQRLDPAGPILSHASLDFLRPDYFGVWVALFFEAFEQQTSKLRSIIRCQFRGFLV